MTIFEKNLLLNGFKDVTKKYFEEWKKQRMYRYGYSYFIIVDEPNIQIYKNAIEMDTCTGISERQTKGLLAYLKLSYTDRRKIKAPILHLDKHVKGWQNQRYLPNAFKRFVFHFYNTNLKWPGDTFLKKHTNKNTSSEQHT